MDTNNFRRRTWAFSLILSFMIIYFFWIHWGEDSIFGIRISKKGSAPQRFTIWLPFGKAFVPAGKGELIDLETNQREQLGITGGSWGTRPGSWAWSGDGRWFIDKSGTSLRIWHRPNVYNRKEDPSSLRWTELKIHTIIHLKSNANFLALSPDGYTLGAAQEDSKVRFWDIRTGDSIGEISNLVNPVQNISFSNNGKLIVVIERDRGISVWDWRRSIRKYFKQTAVGLGALSVFGTDEKHLWIYEPRKYDDHGGLSCINPLDPEVEYADTFACRDLAKAEELIISEDGSFIALIDYDKVWVVNTRLHKNWSINVKPGGSFFCTITSAQKELLLAWPDGSFESYDLAVSADGGDAWIPRKKTAFLKTWTPSPTPVSTGEGLWVPDGNNGRYWTQYFLSAIEPQDHAAVQESVDLDSQYNPRGQWGRGACIASDGRTAVSTLNGGIFLYPTPNPVNGRLIQLPLDQFPLSQPICFLGKNNLLVEGCGGDLTLLDLSSEAKRALPKPFSGLISAFVLSGDLSHIAILDEDHKIVLIDITEPNTKFPSRYSTSNQVSGFSLNWDASYLAQIGSNPNCVEVWEKYKTESTWRIYPTTEGNSNSSNTPYWVSFGPGFNELLVFWSTGAIEKISLYPKGSQEVLATSEPLGGVLSITQNKDRTRIFVRQYDAIIELNSNLVQVSKWSISGFE